MSQLEPEQIVLTTSTSEAYSYLFRLLCDPGSEILVPQPGYPLFDFLAVLDDVRVEGRAAGLRLRLADRCGGISQRDHARDPGDCAGAPQQSDGALYQERGRRRRLRGCAGSIDLSLIVDEVFLDYGFEGDAEELCRRA